LFSGRFGLLLGRFGLLSSYPGLLSYVNHKDSISHERKPSDDESEQSDVRG
jgi:hypothetical protein